MRVKFNFICLFCVWCFLSGNYFLYFKNTTLKGKVRMSYNDVSIKKMHQSYLTGSQQCWQCFPPCFFLWPLVGAGSGTVCSAVSVSRKNWNEQALIRWSFSVLFILVSSPVENVGKPSRRSQEQSCFTLGARRQQVKLQTQEVPKLKNNKTDKNEDEMVLKLPEKLLSTYNSTIKQITPLLS